MAKIYDVNQVAEILKVGVSTVRKLIKEEKIKAIKVPKRGFLINEISLSIFMGHKIENCIDEKDFEETYQSFCKDSIEKIDRDRFFKYYCSWFLPDPALPRDYYIIKDEPIQNPRIEPSLVPFNEQEYKFDKGQDHITKNSETKDVILTKGDIIRILDGLDIIREVLNSKLRRD